MRKPLVIGIAGGTVVLLAGIAVLLVAFRGEPASPSRSALVIDAANPLEAEAESRPAAQRPATRIMPIHVEESVDDLLVEKILGDQVHFPADAHVVVAGDVMDWDGAPAATIDVSAFRLQDGAPARSACVRADTDAQGRFQLLVPGTAPMELVLAAFKPGRRPATLSLSIGAAESKKDVRLTLGLGATIEGSVTLDGRPVHARVSADIKSEATGSLPFEWNGTAFETQRAAAYCDETGRFVLTGLAPATYRVETDQLISENSLGLVCQAEVLAPTSGVRLGVNSGRVRIRVLAQGEALPLAKVAVLDPAGRRMSVPQPCDLRVISGLAFKVEAVQRGFAPKQIAVAALTAGETRDIDLILDPCEGPELRLTLRGAAEMNLERVSVRLIPRSVPDQEGVCVQNELRRGLHAERASGDQFSMKNVPYPAGQYTLVLLPEPPESWFAPLEIDIALPASGFAEAALDVMPGGWLHVSLGAADGLDPFLRGGAYVLRDALGAEVYSSPEWHAGESPVRDGNGEAAWLRRSTGVIPAGTYEIEARSEGFRTVHEAVTVLAGKDNMKLIRLEREKH